MTFKALKKYFLVEPYRHDKNKFLLFEKEPSKTGRSVHKYLCLIEKKDNLFQIEGFEPTDKIAVLKKQVVKYVKSLPYDSDYFCPHFRAGLTEELIIHDYFSSIGFKNKMSNSSCSYTLVDKNIYGFTTSDIKISIWGLDAWEHYSDGKFNLPKSVKVILWSPDGSWFEVEAERNVEEMKKAIDSLLKPLLLTDVASNLKRAIALKNTGDIEVTMNKITDSFQIGSVNFKKELKRQLQETLAKLG